VVRNSSSPGSNTLSGYLLAELGSHTRYNCDYPYWTVDSRVGAANIQHTESQRASAQF